MGKFNFNNLLEEEDFFIEKVQKFKRKQKKKSFSKVNESFYGKILIEVGKEELNSVIDSIEKYGIKSDFYGLKKADNYLVYESKLKEEFEDDLKNYKNAFKSRDINCTFTVKTK